MMKEKIKEFMDYLDLVIELLKKLASIVWRFTVLIIAIKYLIHHIVG